MGWDQSRTVPWQRLMREWVIYVGIMAVIFLVVFRDDGVAGALAGLLISGPLYLGFGYVMAKFGYKRKSLKDMRTPQADSKQQRESESAAASGDSGGRPKPPPTRRTSGGGNRPKSKPRRR